MRRSQQEDARVRKEINQIDEENRQLEERREIAEKSDPAAIERIAREKRNGTAPSRANIFSSLRQRTAASGERGSLFTSPSNAIPLSSISNLEWTLMPVNPRAPYASVGG